MRRLVEVLVAAAETGDGALIVTFLPLEGAVVVVLEFEVVVFLDFLPSALLFFDFFSEDDLMDDDKGALLRFTLAEVTILGGAGVVLVTLFT